MLLEPSEEAEAARIRASVVKALSGQRSLMNGMSPCRLLKLSVLS
jgi:hypothetical protein